MDRRKSAALVLGVTGIERVSQRATFIIIILEPGIFGVPPYWLFIQACYPYEVYIYWILTMLQRSVNCYVSSRFSGEDGLNPLCYQAPVFYHNVRVIRIDCELYH